MSAVQKYPHCGKGGINMRYFTLFFLVMFVLVSGDSVNAVSEPMEEARRVDQKSMESVRDFVERASTRLDEIAFPQFRKEARMEGGLWKDGTTYLILMSGNYPLIHGYYQDAEDRDLSSQAGTLLAALGDGEGPVCIEYDGPEETGRYACAVKATPSSTPRDLPPSFVIIGGLHHEPLPEEPFEDLLGSGYVPDVKAVDVVDAETLKLFVEGALEAFGNNFGVSRQEAPYFTRFRPMLRREGGYWKHGDIYIFAMVGPSVIFNGNDQALEDKTLNITDLNGCNVGDEILRVVAGQDRECPSLGLLPSDSEGFLEYLWDNPAIEGDEDVRFNDPAFGQRISPGITPKLGYVQSAGPAPVIIGAGVYPTDAGGDDGGCAVAGSGNAPRGGLLNLLLIGFVLTVFVYRKKK